uniref:Uncharacterized protein n=1 Tax=Candidatus Kentrum sp. MB TaxID=2138164 RepID=A0A450XPH1_9GAMM|nr:MAG: hypothetical protein BECKMB1821G_GA0114241_10773 [Candidatus Kentron sp. MB]
MTGMDTTDITLVTPGVIGTAPLSTVVTTIVIVPGIPASITAAASSPMGIESTASTTKSTITIPTVVFTTPYAALCIRSAPLRSSGASLKSTTTVDATPCPSSSRAGITIVSRRTSTDDCIPLISNLVVTISTTPAGNHKRCIIMNHECAPTPPPHHNHKSHRPLSALPEYELHHGVLTENPPSF